MTAIFSLILLGVFAYVAWFSDSRTRNPSEYHLTLFIVTFLLSLLNLIDATGQTGLNLDLILTALWAFYAGYHLGKI